MLGDPQNRPREKGDEGVRDAARIEPGRTMIPSVQDRRRGSCREAGLSRNRCRIRDQRSRAGYRLSGTIDSRPPSFTKLDR